MLKKIEIFSYTLNSQSYLCMIHRNKKGVSVRNYSKVEIPNLVIAIREASEGVEHPMVTFPKDEEHLLYIGSNPKWVHLKEVPSAEKAAILKELKARS